MCCTCALRTTKALLAAQWFLLALGYGGSGPTDAARTLHDSSRKHCASKEEIRMSKLWRSTIPFKQTARNLAGIALSLLLAAPAFAQGGGNSPWENAVSVLQQAFTSTIARGLSL